ncbi:methionine-rich copper-binding protein CopC [Salsuginibacillus halophilus]|uniref:Methionine-rich copper-binding protein CopC n=1 Tax=Salsuginibacillus halophilus TaxID=517424 RepID=A0A2P8HXN1_9BACI|nr:copper resistance protein CopC [Salsuginibacillus halophilus]PSL50993.1 methionine-rich copper-binding protein CopC [Salsuginibacillus halophilus]
MWRNMFKLAAVVLMFSLWATPHEVEAHAHIDETFPEDGSVQIEEVTKLKLTFDSGIESHTTAEVTNDEGAQVKLTEQTVNSPVYKAIFEEPLSDGTYNVTWQALAEDGHMTEGHFQFEVDLDEVEIETNDEEAATDEKEQAEREEEPDIQEEGEDTARVSIDKEEAEEEVESSALYQQPWLWIILSTALVVAAIIFFILLKRKRSSWR